MRRDREIAKRLKDMITHDKVNVKEGFSTAFASDINRVLNDYFDLKDNAIIDVELGDGGEYTVTVTAEACRIKQFETTMDIKRF